MLAIVSKGTSYPLARRSVEQCFLPRVVPFFNNPYVAHSPINQPFPSSRRPKENRKLTLHRRLRPRRSQQPHTPHHKILKRLITRLPPLTHIILETRDLRRRVTLFAFERGLERRRLIVFSGCTFNGTGFVAALVLVGGLAW